MMGTELEIPTVEVEVLAGGDEPSYVERGGELLRCWTVEITVERVTGKLLTTRYKVVRFAGGFEFSKSGGRPDDPYFVRVSEGRAVGCGCMDRACRKAFKPCCKHIYAAGQLIERPSRLAATFEVPL